ncbi:MAG: urea ABC transporter permease subunit UrtB, partial [Caldimonas sp.]
MRTLLRILCFALSLLAGAAEALTAEQTLAIAAGDNDARIAALNAAAAGGDAQLAGFVKALLDDEVKVAGDKVYIVHDGKTTLAASGEQAALPEAAEDVSNNNRIRGALDAVLSTLRLFSPDLSVRRAAIVDLGKATLDEGQLPLVEKALAGEADTELKDKLLRMRAAILITSSDRDKRLAAAGELASSSQSTVASLLQERLAPGAEADADVRAALQQALAAVR